jgi:hypothetical protein
MPRNPILSRALADPARIHLLPSRVVHIKKNGRAISHDLLPTDPDEWQSEVGRIAETIGGSFEATVVIAQPPLVVDGLDEETLDLFSAAELRPWCQRDEVATVREAAKYGHDVTLTLEDFKESITFADLRASLHEEAALWSAWEATRDECTCGRCP